MDMNEFLQLKAMEQQRVNFEMTYVDMTGDLISGLLLSQIVYWFTPTKEGKNKTRVTYKGRKALAKARNEWFDEIRITEKQYDKAIKILETLKIVDVVNSMFNSKRTPFIMLNDDVFLEKYRYNLINTSVLPKGKDRYSQKGNTDIDEKVTPLTEITADINTDTKKSYKLVDESTGEKNNFYNTFSDLINHINSEINNLHLSSSFNDNKEYISKYFKIFYERLKNKTGLKQKILTREQLENSINYCCDAIDDDLFTDEENCLFSEMLYLYLEESEFKTLSGFFSKYINRMSGRVNKILEEIEEESA